MAQPVRIGDLPGLMAGAMHKDEFARVAAEEGIWRALRVMVDEGTLQPLNALTHAPHEFPVGDALRRAVVLPYALRPLLRTKGIDLHLIEPGNGPDLWSIGNAARDIGAIQGWTERQSDTLRKQMLDAARSGALVVRHPHTGLPVLPRESATVRDFYELMTRDDVNKWLANIRAPYRWLTNEQAAAEPRYIAGRRLWKLAEAIETIAALPRLGMTAQALMKRATKAAASRELQLRDVEDGSPKWGDNLSGFLGEWLFAEDLNAWLQAAGFPEPYRLRDDMARGDEPQPGAFVDTETRQAKRLQAYRDAGFTPPRGDGRWQGVGKVAEKLHIKRQTLTDDLKAAWAREQDAKRAGAALRM